MFEKIGFAKTGILVGSCLLGAMILANTPDEVPTGASSIEDKVLEQNNIAFVEEMKAKEERLKQNVSSVMDEHNMMKQHIYEERARIDARREENSNRFEETDKKIAQRQAELEARFQKVEPHIK